jgi:hypothetical protein
MDMVRPSVPVSLRVRFPSLISTLAGSMSCKIPNLNPVRFLAFHNKRPRTTTKPAKEHKMANLILDIEIRTIKEFGYRKKPDGLKDPDRIY